MQSSVEMTRRKIGLLSLSSVPPSLRKIAIYFLFRHRHHHRSPSYAKSRARESSALSERGAVFGRKWISPFVRK